MNEISTLNKSNGLVGYALLAVNIDETHTNFIDYFIPLISEALKKVDEESITVLAVSKSLKENFGLEIPINVLKYGLSKLRKNHLLEFNRINGSYIVTEKFLETKNFYVEQEKALSYHYELVKGLRDFIWEKYNIKYDYEKAERLFESYLKYSVEYFDVKKGEASIHSKELYYVAKYIDYIDKNQLPLMKYFERILIGNMIATAMYFTDIDKFNQKFKETTIYFDTTFLIYALGYAGPERAEPCLELIKLLKKQHATLRCFEHTVIEIKGILNGCIRKLEQGISDHFGTVEYFIKKKYQKSDIQTLINALEGDIYSRLKIKVVDKPNFDEYRYNIGESEWHEYLKNNIKYGNEDSIQKDVDSISSIFRLRRGNLSTTVETCKALFVTTNNKLNYTVKTKFSKEYSADYVPPVMSDYILTTLQWIKNPQVSPDLPKKQIIADCLAALTPDEKFISKFRDKLNSLLEDNKITEEDYAMLIASNETRTILLEKTQGDEAELLTLNYLEILEMTKEKMNEEVNEILKVKEEMLATVQDENHQLLQKQMNLEKHHALDIKRIEDKVDKYIGKIISYSKWILILVIVCIYGFFIYKGYINIFTKYIVPILGLFGIGVLTIFNKPTELLQKKLSKFVKKVFLN
ncbi:hypothetical protein [Rummeliibacillus suwonensis]|uniref:hypothetical protein n=1 Tax=Rummeliibacillus suwonensis TaxID=1306154 RepID=UPI001AAEFA5C|nr:hypothetical protein [Rummeliibacillus suwonensis]MBO2537636.1 hypothetical protein [Rummeliibacillus suwonensis]